MKQNKTYTQEEVNEIVYKAQRDILQNIDIYDRTYHFFCPEEVGDLQYGLLDVTESASNERLKKTQEGDFPKEDIMKVPVKFLWRVLSNGEKDKILKDKR